MSSTAWVTAHFFAMLGFILMPLGLLALRSVLAPTRAEPLALTAAVLAWIGSGLVLPYYGAEDFGLHAIAGPAGPRTGLLSLVHAVRYQPLAMTIFGTGLLLLAAAAIMAAIAVWRSNVLPRTSAVLFAAGMALFLPQFFSPAAVRIAHGILLAAGSIILAAALWASAGPAPPSPRSPAATYAVTTGARGPQVAPFTADAAQAVQSLARLDAISADHVLPGHGDPWTGGTQEAIRQIRQRHHSRG